MDIRYNGGMNSKARSEKLRQFNHPENFNVLVILMSAHAGDVGVNLTGASHMILYDVFWNSSTDIQAIGQAIDSDR